MYELKEIKGIKGYYIDNEGNIFSTKKERTFKQLKTRTFNGYRTIKLYKDGAQLSLFIHRLVATTFLGEPSSPDLVVNHKNGNRLDNRIENLEWCTQKENVWHSNYILHKEKTELLLEKRNEREIKRIEKSIKNKFDHKIVCVETGEIFDSQTHIADYYGVSKMAISKAIKKGSMTCGFHFCKYKDFFENIF